MERFQANRKCLRFASLVTTVVLSCVVLCPSQVSAQESGKDKADAKEGTTPERLSVVETNTPPANPDAAPNGSATGPKAVFDETTHNFGTVWADNDLHHAFKLTNKGNATLKILQVKPSCGCTVAGKYPKELDPGESGDVPFRLSSKKLHNTFTKTVTVKTNDPSNSQVRLRLTGTVKHMVEVQPSTAQFGSVHDDTVATRSVKIINNGDKPMELSIDDRFKSDTFTGSIAELVPGKEFELTITAKPPYQPQLNRFTMKLKTNLTGQDSLDINCAATLPPRLEVQPNRMMVRKSEAESKRRFNVRNNGNSDIKILSAKSTDGKLNIESREVRPGKLFDVTVTIPAGYEPAAGDVAVLLETDDTEMPEIRIPVQSLETRSRRVDRTPPKRPAELLRGKPAPAHQFTSFKGEKLRLGGESERPQVVTFYASWCGFCKRALPQIEGFYEKYKDKPVDVMIINTDDRGSGKRARTEEQTLKHYADMKLTMPMHMDSDKAITPDYKVVSYPTTFVIGKSGVVEDVVLGAKANIDQILGADVDKLLDGGSLQNETSQADAKPRKTVVYGQANTAKTKAMMKKADEAKASDKHDDAAKGKEATADKTKANETKGG